jgi:hypothetical protein
MPPLPRLVGTFVRVVAIGVVLATTIGCKVKGGGTDDDPLAPVEPLPGRDGHVAGIMTIEVGDKRYWLGMDRENRIVSPPMASVEAMARFATAHMRQEDGKLPFSIWRAIAIDAAESSSGTELTGREISQLSAELAAARSEGRHVRDVRLHGIPYFIRGAVGPDFKDPCSPAMAARFESSLPHRDCFSGAMGVVFGEVPTPEGIGYTDAIDMVQAYIAAWRESTPEAWRRLLLGSGGWAKKDSNLQPTD